MDKTAMEALNILKEKGAILEGGIGFDDIDEDIAKQYHERAMEVAAACASAPPNELCIMR